MKLKNKHTIALFHFAIMLTIVGASIAAVVGLTKLYIWTGLSPGWVIIGFVLAYLLNIAYEGVTDEDDWL